MAPWDNSIEGEIPFNKSRNAFAEMLHQLIQNVGLFLLIIKKLRFKNVFFF